jgi:glycosyltransferase involved in cell wall biosynthesis
MHLGFQTIQVFHDAFFYEYPQHYNKIWHYIFKYIGMPAARRSSFIIVPTNYAREKVHFYMGFPKEKLITIYEGPKTLNPSKDTPKPEWLHKLENEKYILHVGVMEKRKNLTMLIRAFKTLIDNGHKHLKLVLVGKGNGRVDSDDTEQIHKTISENKLEQHVILLGYVSDKELGLAYENAFMYVFPSFNEGFGIPVLEAFRFNLPVLVADNSCLPEVGGEAVLTFNPFDETDLSKKMTLVLEDENLRAKLIESGSERLNYFSWRKSSDQLIQLFKKASRTD